MYDPFSGRGTTVIEAGLAGRNVIANDANPLSRIITEPRFFPPDLEDVKKRLDSIPREGAPATIDLSMFYHPDTEKEIVAMREYLNSRKSGSRDDMTDRWIAMVATNRLTGHSSGFFSVYTLPPNQAVSPKSQQRINAKLGQLPEYRDTHRIILTKTKSLVRTVSSEDRRMLNQAGKKARLFTGDARETPGIPDESVRLTVTSPPFLDIVQYRDDNWLRCWFNGLDGGSIGKSITMSRTVQDWVGVMGSVFKELYRITTPGGYVAFEVGEVRRRRSGLRSILFRSESLQDLPASAFSSTSRCLPKRRTSGVLEIWFPAQTPTGSFYSGNPRPLLFLTRRFPSL